MRVVAEQLGIIPGCAVEIAAVVQQVSHTHYEVVCDRARREPPGISLSHIHRTIHLTDQMGPNEPLLNLWVDQSGSPVRMEAAGGIIIERSDRRFISSRFAPELLELDRLAGGRQHAQ